VEDLEEGKRERGGEGSILADTIALSPDNGGGKKKRASCGIDQTLERTSMGNCFLGGGKGAGLFRVEIGESPPAPSTCKKKGELFTFLTARRVGKKERSILSS